MPATTEPKAPLQVFRLGAVSLNVWENTGEDGRSYQRVTLQKSYRVAEGERSEDDDGWRETASLAPQDLPVVSELCRLASHWLASRVTKS